MIKHCFTNQSLFQKSELLRHFKDGRVFESSSKPFCLDKLTIGRVWSFTDITESQEGKVTTIRFTL